MSERRPINDHEKADTIFVGILHSARQMLLRKGLADEDTVGAFLRVLMLGLHTQAISFQQRPELLEAYIEQVEAFMIETGTSRTDAPTMRELANAKVREHWERIDAMAFDVSQDKLDA